MNKNILAILKVLEFRKIQLFYFLSVNLNQKHISDLKNKVNFKRKKKINFFF